MNCHMCTFYPGVIFGWLFFHFSFLEWAYDDVHILSDLWHTFLLQD